MRLTHIAFAFGPILLLTTVGYSQSKPTPPIVLDRGVQAPAVTSPEILPDGRVTFRLGAPNAQSVALGGEFITQGNAIAVPPGDKSAGPKPDITFTKGANGVWEGTTTQPIRPGAYRYFFVIDGATVVLDPRNIETSPQRLSQNSLLVVPGDFSERRKVPHGSVLAQAFVSSTFGGIERPLTIYTPPGYEKDNTSYPVLYLMHGNADHETSWVTNARMNDILDNLIAEGKAKPMIVVMPQGGSPTANQVMTSDPSKDPFVTEMMADIIPWVDRHFRTIANADHRAMAGLSMGGIQTLNTALNNLSAFHYVGVFSSGWFTQQDRQWFYDHKKAVIASLNKELKVFDWGWGGVDFAKPGAVEITSYLRSQGVTLTTTENQGGHDWRVWREDLHRFVPLLFR
jgi:enterochelin esterase family protein